MRPDRLLRAIHRILTRRSRPVSPVHHRPRFADTFARRPTVPSLGLLPSRRAWSATALLVVLVAGIAFTAPLLAERVASRSEAARPGQNLLVPTTTHPSTAANATGVSVQGYGSNRCIDVTNSQNGAGADGTPLQLWDCARSANQLWSFSSDGTVRSLGLCMDLARASTNENTTVQLVNCNGGWAQEFTLTAAHDLVNPTAGKCVTAVSSAHGARLVLRLCAGTSNQKWHKI